MNMNTSDNLNDLYLKNCNVKYALYKQFEHMLDGDIEDLLERITAEWSRRRHSHD